MRNITQLLQQVKSHENYHAVGMILCHNGVVRKTSRNGRLIKEITVTADWTRLDETIRKAKKRPGIVEVLADIREGRLFAGEDIMYVVVAGDIRENVFAVLMDTVNEIKAEVTKKEEVYDEC
ncbi:MAG: molybdenum cofactor biosynthesis protein MoaE [Deltaproteobacteria bacterium]|nr:molybdenum cofactor biosynthesis protein MoaE [Deltaproteobacteria bacterium]